MWVVAVVMALPGVCGAIYYLHVLDRAAWFFEMRSVTGSEWLPPGAGFFAGLFFGFLRKRRPVLALMIPVILIVGLVLPWVKPLIRPLDDSIFRDRWSAAVCLQSTGSTCGPSCTATLILRFPNQGKVMEKDLALECYTSSSGTENWYLARALRRRGIPARYIIKNAQPDTLEFPSIAGVQLGGPGGIGHFITILGRNGNKYIVGDPISGQSEQDLAMLQGRYYFTGFFLVAGK